MSADLHRAIEAHDLDTLAKLLAAGHDPNALLAGWPGWSPLDAAINEIEEGGAVEAVALLLRHGADCDIQFADYAGTPLATAVFRGQRAAALMLLAAGADPNISSGEEGNLLAWCAQEGDLKMVATLLRSGAARTIDRVGGEGAMNALGYAANCLDIEMLTLLLASGASIERTDGDHRTAWHRLPKRTDENAEKWDLAFELLSPKS